MDSKLKGCRCGICLPDGKNVTRPKKVYIANFGRKNCLWQECLARETVATLDRKALNKFWDAGDKEGYVKYCWKNIKTAKGNPLPKSVASRWYHLVCKLKATSGDIWIHRDKDKGCLYWTKSKDEETKKEERKIKEQEPRVKFCVFHKTCTGWSCKDKRGIPLLWDDIHPKAQKFLATSTAFHELSEENAKYALDLFHGNNLVPYHRRWNDIDKNHPKAKGTTPATFQKTGKRIAKTVLNTASLKSGQEKPGKIKEKKLLIPEGELEDYISKLFEQQKGFCALTRLKMQLDENWEDKQLRCSLDRIDSNGNYEHGNLQLVCRFANFWKSNQPNVEFLRLLKKVRSVKK